MAIRSLRKTRLSPKIELERDRDGAITTAAFDRLADEVSSLKSLLNGGLSLGTGEASSVAGNFKWQVVKYNFAVARTDYQIPHGLGVIPIGVLVLITDAVGGTVTDLNLKIGWSTNSITLQAVVAGNYWLLILA